MVWIEKIKGVRNMTDLLLFIAATALGGAFLLWLNNRAWAHKIKGLNSVEIALEEGKKKQTDIAQINEIKAIIQRMLLG